MGNSLPPGVGGQTPPRVDQQYRGSGGAVVGPGSSNVVRARLVVVSGTGPNSGLFVYSGTPALGNPPVFWATSASADPFGNVIPSTAGVAGSGTFRAGSMIVNASGIFVYSPSPGAGNLIYSIAPAAGTDAFGNPFAKGFESQTSNIQTVISQTGYTIGWSAGAGGPGTPASVAPAAFTAGVPLSNSAVPFAEIQSPIVKPSSILQSLLDLNGQSQDGTVTPWAQFSNTDGSTLPVVIPALVLPKLSAVPVLSSGINPAPALYGDASGSVERLAPSGRHAVLSDGSGDSFNRTVTQATATAITGNWSFPGGDANAGTMYRITAFGYGTWGSTAQALSVGCGLNGSAIRTETVLSSLFAVSASVEWNAVYTLFVTSTGVGGSCWLTCTFTISAVGGSHGAQQLTLIAGSHSGLPESLNTTANNTMQLMMSWASTTGAPTITCIGSNFERVGT